MKAATYKQAIENIQAQKKRRTNFGEGMPHHDSAGKRDTSKFKILDGKARTFRYLRLSECSAAMTPKQIRSHLCRTQAQMARLMGTTLRVWQHWEYEEREPSQSALELMRLLRWLFDNHRAIFDKWEGMKK